MKGTAVGRVVVKKKMMKNKTKRCTIHTQRGNCREWDRT